MIYGLKDYLADRRWWEPVPALRIWNLGEGNQQNETLGPPAHHGVADSTRPAISLERVKTTRRTYLSGRYLHISMGPQSCFSGK